jgi:putative sterol carrier protein
MDPLTDVAEVFRLMPTRFIRGKIDRHLAYYFSIENEEWTVFVGPDSCEIRRGKAVEKADCFLKTSKEIFLATVSGARTPTVTDFITGKIKSNNPLLLQTFREIFGG